MHTIVRVFKVILVITLTTSGCDFNIPILTQINMIIKAIFMRKLFFTLANAEHNFIKKNLHFDKIFRVFFVARSAI